MKDLYKTLSDKQRKKDEEQDKVNRALSLFHVLHPCFPCSYQRVELEWWDSYTAIPDSIDYLCFNLHTKFYTAVCRCEYYEDPYNTKPIDKPKKEKEEDESR